MVGGREAHDTATSDDHVVIRRLVDGHGAREALAAAYDGSCQSRGLLQAANRPQSRTSGASVSRQLQWKGTRSDASHVLVASIMESWEVRYHEGDPREEGQHRCCSTRHRVTVYALRRFKHYTFRIYVQNPGNYVCTSTSRWNILLDVCKEDHVERVSYTYIRIQSEDCIRQLLNVI
jgi:hypothetical protein